MAFNLSPKVYQIFSLRQSKRLGQSQHRLFWLRFFGLGFICFLHTHLFFIFRIRETLGLLPGEETSGEETIWTLE